MALSQFPAAMNTATASVLNAARALRFVSSSTGDLTWYSIHDVQQSLADAQATCVRALTEGAGSQVAAENYMAPLGGPQTLAEMQTGLVAVQQASIAWANRLSVMLDGMIATDVKKVVWVGPAGSQNAIVEDVSFIPAAIADPLRASTELADLIAAFEAVGA